VRRCTGRLWHLGCRDTPKGLGLRLGFRVWSLRFRVQGVVTLVGCGTRAVRIHLCCFCGQGLWFRLDSSGFRCSGLRMYAQGRKVSG
jgi:hypothetical protein